MYEIYFGPDAVAADKDGKLDPIGFQALLNDMIEQGQIAPAAPRPEKYLDTSYWAEAERTH
jgi:hypothetical protein